MRTANLLTVSLFLLPGACTKSESTNPPAAGGGASAAAPQDASAKAAPKGDAQTVMTELTTLLAGVKDSAAAQKASAQVATLGEQLGGLMASTKATATDASKKLLVEVNRILASADLAAPLKDSLTKLKGALPQ